MGRFLVPQRSQVVRWRGALEGLLPPGHLARFVWHVMSALDFSDLEAGYRSVQGGPGRAPYHPRLLAALWVYGMTQGMETAAAIAHACRVRDDFRWLAGGLCPSDQTLLNLVAGAPTGLCSLWGQVLRALHRAGHIDLSALVEDGTKLRANASPRSFHTAEEIAAIVTDLERQLAARLHDLGQQAPQRASQAQVRALKGRIARAQQAAAELQQRVDRRHPGDAAPSRSTRAEQPDAGASPAPVSTPKFGRADFHHDAERDVLICPAGRALQFLGIHREPPRSRYRLYRAHAQDCRGCSLKAQCTEGLRRSVKIPLGPPRPPAAPPPAPPGPTPGAGAHAISPDQTAAPTRRQPAGPCASITEPDAVMMRATSERRWEPSYNADVTVTRHGVIVNQFLTTHRTDYPHFRRALPAVLSTLGRPEAWIGDGQYATQENVVLAHQAGVVLYAPLASSRPAAVPVPSTGGATSGAPGATAATGGVPTRKFCGRDFRHDAERNVLICPAGETLRLIGIYTDAHRAGYRVYGRTGCGRCSLKVRCTESHRRRVRLPLTTAGPASPPTNRATGEPNGGTPSRDPPMALPTRPGEVSELLDALAGRMRAMGDRIRTFRHTTVEPVNAHLKHHGLGRLHVRGAARCSTVLTLACIAHNVMKWKAREAAHALRAVT